MFFGLSEEQEQFQDYVKKFLADNVTVDEIRKIANGEDEALAKEIYSGLINLGINALLVAVAQGLGSGVGPIPFAGAYVMAPIAINLAGSDEQKAKYLPQIVSNETKFGVGLSEYVAAREDAGIDLASGKANGKALFVIDGDEADYFLLSNKGGVLFLVDAKDKGLEITKLTSVDKTRSYLELNLKNVAAEVLSGSENNPEIAKQAEANILAAGLDQVIQIQTSHFRELSFPNEKGMILCNPPYGKRVGIEEDMYLLYSELGEFIKKNASGWILWMLSGNPKLTRFLKMKSHSRIVISNGGIDCRWLKYEIN